MQATPQRGTVPEIRLHSLLRDAGLRFTTHAAPVVALRRRADFVFRRAKVAVFVDGCWWHGCPDHFATPKHNREWWLQKIDRTRRRDIDTDLRLREAGWAVVRVWEHTDAPAVAGRIRRLVNRRLQPVCDR